ncbi:endonuclease/exonuclease/phosphatase family protein [Demequina globuliformis]|uniref:endonuclease/exonuclease/phosphatase family protein n=1 Tax=Demequina globuliformis TaxID=676202 RepID=UPI0007835EAB|nr:endonuclease/exonuclease/phosphatase family protein [Demequina globuliformis]
MTPTSLGHPSIGRPSDTNPSDTNPSIGRRLALIAGAACAFATALTVLARATGFEWGPFAWLVALTPWALVGIAACVALAAGARSWRLAAVAAVIAVPLTWWQLPVWTADAPRESASTLTVASVSLTFGRADAHEVVALVKNHGVDLLALQELTPEAADALAEAGLSTHLPYSAAFPEPGYVGVGLWSRLALESAESVDGFTSHLVRAGVATEQGPLTVLAPHPAAPGPFSTDAWRADTEALVDLLAAQDGPTLVVGDLNMTRDHRAFRALEDRGYASAADQAGAGWVMSFPHGRLPFPVAGIDHVLLRGGPFAAQAVSTAPVSGADHLALVAQLGAP